MVKRKKKRKSYRHWLFKVGRDWCRYCGRYLAKHEITADHVKPLSAGGYDRRKNVVTACGGCNGTKGSMTVEEFLKLPRFTDPDSGLNQSRLQRPNAYNLAKARAPVPEAA